MEDANLQILGAKKPLTQPATVAGTPGPHSPHSTQGSNLLGPNFSKEAFAASEVRRGLGSKPGP